MGVADTEQLASFPSDLQIDAMASSQRKENTFPVRLAQTTETEKIQDVNAVIQTQMTTTEQTISQIHKAILNKLNER